MDQEKQLEKL